MVGGGDGLQTTTAVSPSSWSGGGGFKKSVYKEGKQTVASEEPER